MSEDKTILPSTKEALHALRKKGIITVICTGRSPFMFRQLTKDLEFDSYVSMNGQHVVFEGQEIFSNPMDAEMLAEVTGLAKEQGHGITYSNHDQFAANVADHAFIQGSLGGLKIGYPEVDEEVFRKSPVHQIQVYCSEEDMDLYKERYPDYSFIRWSNNAVDMLPAGASKAVGILKVMEHTGIRTENSYAFGDGPNDFEMLEYVGTGIAMGNALPELKEQADLITDTCSNDGIAKGLIAAGLLKKDEILAAFQ